MPYPLPNKCWTPRWTPRYERLNQEKGKLRKQRAEDKAIITHLRRATPTNASLNEERGGRDDKGMNTRLERLEATVEKLM